MSVPTGRAGLCARQRLPAPLGCRYRHAGARGQLLAEIDAPRSATSCARARRGSRRGRQLRLARRTAERWQDLLRSRSVAQQEADQKSADMQAKAAALASARSNVARTAQQAAYTRIVAPFDGVVTARNVDTGARSTPAAMAAPAGAVPPVGRRQAAHLYPVPQDDSVLVTPGMPAGCRCRSIPASASRPR